MARIISFIVHPGFELLDLSGPCSAFNLANEFFGARYQIRIASVTGGPVVDRAGVSVASEDFRQIGQSHTILAAGGPTAHEYALNEASRSWLQESGKRAARVGSVCTGAFLLAAAGILDGKRATTHWRYAGLLQTQYPAVEVDVDRIFIQDGKVWTSAGMTAGMDLSLAMIEDDLGPEVAKGIARDMVIYHRRLGGQSQFSAMLDMAPPSGRIRDVLCYAREHLSEDLTVERLAQVACLSLRQFNRVFLNTTGMTPAKAIERLRLDVVRARIEEGQEPFDRIARGAGFGSVERMRRSCISIFGQSPQELRRTARQRV
ncbi:MAG: GlxA family transcriptional regulator [Rhodocyclaceae bacterium]|nr:MAG: GlxA family transcriptional regulator [Rhodocyclaceae bacterium]